MSERKHFSVWLPDIPYFISTDPNAVDELGRKPDQVIEDWHKFRHLFSGKPNFRPPPRPQPKPPTEQEPKPPEPNPEAKPNQE